MSSNMRITNYKKDLIALYKIDKIEKEEISLMLLNSPNLLEKFRNNEKTNDLISDLILAIQDIKARV